MGYYPELLTSERMKLLGITKSKLTKYEYGENVPDLEITEVVLEHCNTVNNHYHQQNSSISDRFVLNKSLVNYYIFHLNILCSKKG